MAGYFNQAPQYFSITLGSLATSNTATITTVGANAFIIWLGATTDEALDNLELDEFCTTVLTNTTTVTATRTTATTGTCIVKGVVIDPTSAFVTSVQAGTIAIAAATSNTATITSVDTTLSAVFFLGSKTTSTTIPTTFAGVTLTNATTVTANLNSAGTTTVSYVVVTFAAAVIKSIQQFSLTSTTNAVTDTATISAVVMANSFIAYGAHITGDTNAPKAYRSFSLFSTTAVRSVNGGTSTAVTRTSYGAVIEFKAGVLKTLNRGTVTLSGVASNTVTVTAVNTNISFLNYLGIDTTAVVTRPDEIYINITLTNSTTITGAKTTATGLSEANYELIEFDANVATAAITEHGDTVTAAGTALSTVTVSAAITEHGDTVTASATDKNSATAAITEHGDTVTGAGVRRNSISAAITEHGDTVTGVATKGVSISAAITEHGDTVAGVGALNISISAAVTEHGDTVTATATKRLTATAAVTEGRDTMTATGTTVQFFGTAAITEHGDTFAGVARETINISATITEHGDTVTASAKKTVSLSAAITEGGDVLHAVAPGSGITSSASITERGDTFAAQTVERLIVSAAVTEGRDTTNSISKVINNINSAVTEGRDTMTGTAHFTPGANASAHITEAGDVVVSATGLRLFNKIAIKGYLLDTEALKGYNLSVIPLTDETIN